MSDDLTTFRLRIKGQVTGVGFREWAIEEANARQLNGWVRNRSDGTVEMVISGPDDIIKQMLSRCTQGPEAAQVTNIDILREDQLPAAGFKRQPTL
jgi:acylphosphatase